jgi:hypothetical protein
MDIYRRAQIKLVIVIQNLLVCKRLPSFLVSAFQTAQLFIGHFHLHLYFSNNDGFNLQEDFKQGLKDAVAIQSVSSKKEDRGFVIEMVDSVALVWIKYFLYSNCSISLCTSV